MLIYLAATAAISGLSQAFAGKKKRKAENRRRAAFRKALTASYNLSSSQLADSYYANELRRESKQLLQLERTRQVAGTNLTNLTSTAGTTAKQYTLINKINTKIMTDVLEEQDMADYADVLQYNQTKERNKLNYDQSLERSQKVGGNFSNDSLSGAISSAISSGVSYYGNNLQTQTNNKILSDNIKNGGQ